MTEITTEKVEALALMAEKSAYIAGVHGLPSLKKDWTAVYTTLRTLLAERDAAYKRGQEDMREAAIRIVGDLPAEESDEVSKAFSEIVYLPIKDAPDV